MILALKTSDEVSELYLLDYRDKPGNDDYEIVADKKWPAGRELGRTLLGEIKQILQYHLRLYPGDPGKQLDCRNKSSNDDFSDLAGLVVFIGPGSFTGLRIGITTMNALAYALNIPIVGTSGKNWRAAGLKRLNAGENDKIVRPEYGAEANITAPKK